MIKSTDGGQTFPIHSVASSDPTLVAQDANGTTPGRLRIDPTNPNRLYIVWSTSSAQQRADAVSKQNAFSTGNELVVARSDDGGLTWTDHVAMDTPVGSVLPNLIPWIALDGAGNVYVAAAGTILDANGTPTNGLFFASSADHGATWSSIHKVDTGSGAVVFPTVIAGKAGVADFTWLSSTATTTADTTGVWTLHFAQTRDALDASPAFAYVDGPVVHKGDICTKGILCAAGGDRSLLDFMDMALDSFGYAHVAVYSTEAGTQKTTAHVLYWRQDAGPSATSEPGDGGVFTTRPGPKA